jgi:hypothetical protein
VDGAGRMFKVESLIYNYSLGDVFRIIREDVLGLSLLEAGALIDISGTTYNRFEKNNFGKSFTKKRNATLRYWAEMISRAVFEEVARKKIKLNQRMKDVLVKIYSKSDFFQEDVLYYLERFDHEECNSLEDFIYNIFLIFSGEHDVNVPENLVLKNHIKSQELFRTKNNISGKIINYTEIKNCVVKLVELLKPRDIIEIGFGTDVVATLISQAVPDTKIKILDSKRLGREEELVLIDRDSHPNIEYKRTGIDYIYELKEVPELIIFVNSFRHIEDPIENKIILLKKLFDIMPSSGRICIADTFLPEFFSVSDEFSETRRLWDNKIIDVYCNTFWSSLNGCSKDNIMFSKNFAKKAIEMELKVGNEVIGRKSQYLVKMSWLVDIVQKIGFETEIAENCSCLRDGVVLFQKP